MMKQTLFISIFLIGFLGCNNYGKQSTSHRQEKIQIELDTLVTQNDVPGINLCIIHSNGQMDKFSSGYADIEKKITMNPGYTLFSGSIGKTYAVAILMQLVDEGKVQLGDKFVDHFNDLLWLNELPNIEKITIEMLLQHTSGLPRYVLKPAIWDTIVKYPDKVWTYKERLSFIFGDEPIHEAGRGWHYSDTNYILIGMLIERITGNNYYDEVMARLLIPGRLIETYPSDRRNLPHLPVGYSQLPEMFHMPDKVVVDRKYIFNPQLEWTGGGMASSTPDLARWARIYYKGELFSDSLLTRIITPNLQGKHIEDSLAYGMGSFIFQTPYGKAYGHTGFVPGFVSIFTYFPDDDISVAMQVNCDYAAEKMGLINYVERIYYYLAD